MHKHSNFWKRDFLPVLAWVIAAAVFISGIWALEQDIISHRTHGDVIAWVLVSLLLLIIGQWIHMYRLTKEHSPDPPGRPNFQPELEQERSLRENLVGTDADAGAVDDWIQRVHDKLEVWSPAAARKFKPVVVPRTADAAAAIVQQFGSTIATAEALAGNYGKMYKTEPNLAKLNVYAERLTEIISPQESRA